MKIFFSIICSIIPVFSISQIIPTGDIRGRVRYDSSDALFATVAVMHPDSSILTGIMVEDDGRFVFFDIPEGVYLLMVNCLGYRPEYRSIRVKPSSSTDIGNIDLKRDMYRLKAVTVRGKRDLVRQKNGTIIINVNNTILAEAGTLQDVLKRSPGLVEHAGQITVIGKGEPVIYINNQQIHSQEELKNLRSDDIDKIEIERNASARYEAAGHAVIHITTKRPLKDKFSLTIYDNLKVSRKIGNELGLQMDYKHKQWSGMLTYSFTNASQNQYGNISKTRILQHDTLQNNSKNYVNHYAEYHRFFSVNEIAVAPRHKIGFQFSSVWNNRRQNMDGIYTIRETAESVHNWKIENHLFSRSQLYNGSLYYSFKIDSSQKLSVQAGYTCRQYSDKTDIDEAKQDTISSSRLCSKMNNRNDYHVYSLQTDYNVSLFGFLDMAVGVRYSRIDNQGKTKKSEMQTGQIQYESINQIADQIAAGYIDLSKKIADFYIQAGLRYEYTNSSTSVNNQKLQSSYHDLFPSFSAGFNKKNINVALTYSRRIVRPLLREIDPTVRYIDAYTYQMGNPKLVPSYTHGIELHAVLWGVHAIIDYTYTKDEILSLPRMDPAFSEIMYFSYDNMDQNHNLLLLLMYSKNWKWYTGYWEIGMRKQFMDVPWLSEILRQKIPLFQIRWSNDFQITKNISFNCSFLYLSPGDVLGIRNEPIYNLSAGFVVRFLKDNLVVSIMAEDILGLTQWQHYEMRYMNFLIKNRTNDDNRYIRIGLRCNFNRLKNDIRHKEANAAEMNRIQ